MTNKTILVSKDNYELLLLEVRRTNQILTSIEAIEQQALELKQQEVDTLNRIDKRQALENHNGKKWTALTVLIMMAAFYIEIVKIDDLSILKDRAKSFIYDITDTYKLKGD